MEHETTHPTTVEPQPASANNHQPRLRLLDLEFVPSTEAVNYEEHAATRHTRLATDKLALPIAASTNIVLTWLLLLPNAREPRDWMMPILKLVLQGAHFLFMLLRGDLYLPTRVYMNSLHRVVRLCNVAARHWRTGAATTTLASAALVRFRGQFSTARVFAIAMLLEPLFAFQHPTLHPLPFKLQLPYAAARLLLDVLLVMPAMGCELMQPQYQPLLSTVCPYAFSALTLRAPGSGDMMDTVCASPKRAWFIPALLLLVMGQLVPLLATYWYELRSKLHYLRARYPGQAEHCPPHLGLLLVLQVQVGLCICVCISNLVSTFCLATSAYQCAVQA